eukprot:TRINITY_DN5536_c0_g1_i11.p1 TRINITY_DN5536_c0_g1~~TRINITY_DN5536_c0_g1_i11.p1  ORF type:complete len:350 (+),score=72.40 TRINITY_DN5536_c0_g1_i11:725-1774(+)
MTKEVRVLRKLSHPAIIKLENAFIVDFDLIIVMEFAQGGELKSYLNSKGKLSENEAREILIQMLEAIEHCHALNVIHRDLKLENIVFADLDHKHIKIVDFGIAGLIQENKAEKSKAGTLRYMAPEILSGRNIEARSSLDVWSMGCILFALVCGQLPFDSNTSRDIIGKIRKGRWEFPEDSCVSHSCQKLIRRMLLVDYKERATIREILADPWIVGEQECDCGACGEASMDCSNELCKEEAQNSYLPQIDVGRNFNTSSYGKALYARKRRNVSFVYATPARTHETQEAKVWKLISSKPPVPKFRLKLKPIKKLNTMVMRGGVMEGAGYNDGSKILNDSRVNKNFLINYKL